MTTTGEANAIAKVLKYFLHVAPRDIDREKAALEAAMFLADRANSKLHAGISGVEVASLWSNPARLLAQAAMDRGEEIEATRGQLAMFQHILQNVADGNMEVIGYSDEYGPQVQLTDAGKAVVEAMSGDDGADGVRSASERWLVAIPEHD